MNKTEDDNRIKNSIEILRRLKTNIVILKRTIMEEANDSKFKSQRTTKFLVCAYKYNKEMLELIDKELEILELDKFFYNK